VTYLREAGLLGDVPDFVLESGFALANRHLHRDCLDCLRAVALSFDPRVERWPLTDPPRSRSAERLSSWLDLAGIEPSGVRSEGADSALCVVRDSEFRVYFESVIPNKLNEIAEAADCPPHYCRVRLECVPLSQGWIAYLSGEERRAFQRAGLGVAGRRL
jgi:hypothetical protein